MSGLYQELKEYSKSNFYPFHMPGHKRNPEFTPFGEVYQCDITEIDGFDNLHEAEGILKDAQERAARLYGSQDTYFLVNGSTCGILSAISAISDRGKKLIVARNCHKAVYHGMILNHLEPEYLYPELNEYYGISKGITAIQVQKKIEEVMDKYPCDEKTVKNIIAGVLVTSPSYDGIVSEVSKIVELAHYYEIPVIVDQAHGAHFGFHKDYPESAIKEGADLVIHSTHKTLPAPTQTALLHRNGTIVSKEEIEKYLKIYQTSSPSYLLMAGIDSCIDYVEKNGTAQLGKLLERRALFLDKCKSLTHIQIYQDQDQEPGRFLISVKNTNCTGDQLSEILRRRYHLEMEMCTDTYVIALLSMMDQEVGFLRLADALLEIDEELEGMEHKPIPYQQYAPQIELMPSQAFHRELEAVNERNAIGRICGEFVNLYPPGIPILAPGEKIDNRVLEMIRGFLNDQMKVHGIEILESGSFQIKCVKEKEIEIHHIEV